MLFHTVTYAIFLPLVLGFYVLLGRIAGLRSQNILLLIASYVFYGWWDSRFLILIVISSAADYFVGLGLAGIADQRRRRLLLVVSLVANLGMLGYFKYYNFFITSFIEAFAGLGIELHASTLQVILPVGISFYTFQTLTYTIDIYRRTLAPTRDAVAFFTYVAFFPQLVAGPIERASHLLPQFLSSRQITAERISSGLRQIVWGLFCKMVVADNCAIVVNSIFGQQETPTGSVALTGAFFFAFQIYGDFSGYSHIALGSARMFGFDLMQNFNTPYFSQSIPEFWRRWHISLSSWFRDYVYVPLGGNRVGKPRQAFNLLVTFTLSGIWHGANWTYVIWGFLNGLFCLPRLAIGEPLAPLARSKVLVVRWGTILFRVGLTFFLTLLAWTFFRADTLGKAFAHVGAIFSPSVFSSPVGPLRELGMLSNGFVAFIAVAALLMLEFLTRSKPFALDLNTRVMPQRWATYATVVGLILTLRYTGESLDFIYFQF